MPPSRAPQVIRHRDGSINVTHQATAVDVKPEYLEYSPILNRAVKIATLQPRRDDSVSTIDSIYSADPPAPIYLGKPLPLPPRCQDPAQRDTLFSVIDGYAGGDDTLDQGYPGAGSVQGKAFQRFGHHGGEGTAPYLEHYTGADITFESLDQDTFSTWDRQAEYSDDTMMGSTLEGTDVCEEIDFQPPPKLEDIEAVARQSSPGRYGLGIALEFGDLIAIDSCASLICCS